MPLHCVVESMPSLQASFTPDARSPWRRRPNIETDSYVIIPAVTPFCDIVTIALQRLGYSADIANTARGKSNFYSSNSSSTNWISVCFRRLHHNQKLEAPVAGQGDRQHADLGERHPGRTDLDCHPQDHNHSHEANAAGRNQRQTAETAHPAVAHSAAIHWLSLGRGKSS